MEVLNKNQRESAIWRLAGFGVLVLALNAFVLFASYKAFESKGAGGEEEWKRKYEDCMAKARGDQQGLQTKLTAKDVEIKKLQDELKNQAPEKTNLKTERDYLKTQNENLTKEKESLLKQLEMCQRSKTGT